jgi:hypothetical protein
MLLNEVKPGLKFIDPRLITQPPAYRVYIVESVSGYEHFIATHVHTGRSRTIQLREEDVTPLQAIGRFPIVQVNLDVLVGDRVRVELKDGTSLHAKLTAVHYAECRIEGATARFVKGVEFDHSMSNTFSLDQIDKLFRIGPPRP